jgi:putative redox protein
MTIVATARVDSREARYAQDIHVGTHVLVADEPEPRGGIDAGPRPYEILLAALGACTSITLRMYAEKKGRHR